MPLERVRCPACRRLTGWNDNPYRPFCSERCRLSDFGNWASERYRIPSDEPAGKDDPGRDEDEES